MVTTRKLLTRRCSREDGSRSDSLRRQRQLTIVMTTRPQTSTLNQNSIAM